MNTFFKAFTIQEDNDGAFTSSIKRKDISSLPDGDLTIRVKYSSLNYKDALSSTGNKGITKSYPHTPGIDAVGVVESSKNNNYKIGDKVIVTGYDLGMNTSGGYGQYIRDPSQWAVALPKGLTSKESMALGTAGLTAGLCVRALDKKNGIHGKDAVVTGATGGVGYLAVQLLVKLGANVTAVTGKHDAKEMLESFGVDEILNREQFKANFRQPLSKGKWDIGVDVVGGEFLSGLLTCLKPQGSIASCGHVGGPNFETNVFPFILRGNSLIGIGSADESISEKEIIWNLLSKDWKIDLENHTRVVSLEELDMEISKILKGNQKGRTVISLD